MNIDNLIRSKIKEYKGTPKYILLGNYAYFSLKKQCEENSKFSELSEFNEYKSSLKFLSKFRGLKILVNNLDEDGGIAKIESRHVEVLG